MPSQGNLGTTHYSLSNGRDKALSEGEVPSHLNCAPPRLPYAILIAPLALKHRFERHSFWIIFAVSSVIRIVKVLAAPRPPGNHLSEMENIARSLALHGTFADPYLLPTGPTAHTAPGYPVWLGHFLLLYGRGWGGERMSRLASAIAASIQYALLPRVSTAL